MSSKILVTGASGFIGSALCRRLMKEGDAVTAFVRDELPPDGCSIIRGDLTDVNDCRRAIGSKTWDLVYHLGAQALVGVGGMDPLTTLKSNVEGTWNILEGIRQRGSDVRLVMASSDKAYGNVTVGKKYTEACPLAGRGIYDCSKSCADLIAQSYCQEYAMPVMIARLGNVYGPGDPERTRIIPSIMEDLVNIRRPVIMSDGTPVRDYLYIDDAVEAYAMLGRAPLGDRAEAYNFSGGSPISVLDLTTLATDIASEHDNDGLAIWAGYQCLGQHLYFQKGTSGKARPRKDLDPDIRGTRGPGEILYQVLDCSKAKLDLGWEPKVSLEEGLRNTLTWAWRRKNDIFGR